MTKKEQKQLAAYLIKLLSGAENQAAEQIIKYGSSARYPTMVGWLESGLKSLAEASENGIAAEFLHVHSN